MLVAAAFVPATPLLNPDVAAGAAFELDDLRVACSAAIAALLAAEPSEIVIVGLAPRTGPYPVDAQASFSGFGVGSDSAAVSVLPAALSVGRWVLESAAAVSDAAAPMPTQCFGVTRQDSSQRCADLGRALADRSDRVGVLVVGDGSACRSPKAPGAFDSRASDFDDIWLQALDSVDVVALADVDLALSEQLLVAGRAPWQVAAAMIPDAAEWVGDLTFRDDPYGVMYAVATWLRRPA